MQGLDAASQELILLFAAPRDPFDMAARLRFATVLVRVFLSGRQWKSRYVESDVAGCKIQVPLGESVAHIWCRSMFQIGMFEVWGVYDRCASIDASRNRKYS